MRVLVKVAYLGWGFRGSQRQPHGETVEDAILSALAEVEAADDPASSFRMASRTDAGVSARGNAFVVDTPLDGDELVTRLAGVLDAVHPWGWTDVPDGFDPRDARRRWYRYHLFNRGYDAQAIRDTAEVFEGEHDLSAFSKTDPSKDVDPRRFVESVDVGFQESFVVVDVQARSFLWQQVRRMVGALTQVGTGEIEADAIRDALRTGEAGFDVRPAPPEGVVLVDVDHGLDVHAPPEVEERLREEVFDRIGHVLTRAQVLKDLVR